MQCSGANFVTDTQLGPINLSPDSSVFIVPTRVDCWACSSPSLFLPMIQLQIVSVSVV